MPALTPGPRVTRLARRLRRSARSAGAAVVVVGVSAAVAATGAAAAAPVASSAPQLAAASACTVSGPLTGLAPYPGTRLDVWSPFVTLSATNGHGAYAGVSFTMTSVGASFTVVRRDPNGAVAVLGRFVYDNTVFDFARSVRVVGMDPWGGVVVMAQRTDSNLGDERFIGIRYDAAGVRHDLARSPSWLSVQPVGVADSGSVVGTVTGPDRLRRVVIWRGKGSGSLTRLTAPGRVARAFAPNGDWYDDSTQGFSTVQVHPHGGAPARRLAALDGLIVRNGPQLQATSYDRVWGRDNDADVPGASHLGLGAHWAPGSTPGTTTPVPAARAFPFYGVTGVGRAGDAVGFIDPTSGANDRGPSVLATRTGKLYALPPTYMPDKALPAVVDPAGRVVVTGAARLPVMVTCPQ